MYSRSVVAGFLRWKLALPSLALVLALAAGGLGTVIAVNISLTTKSLMGTRATTSAFTTVTATHVGTNVATLTLHAGAAASSIAPSATDATTLVRAGAVTAGYYIYSIKFESTAVGDDIPAGTLRARWTVGGTEYTASLAVAATTVDASAKGGFTLVIPGGLADTPENIQVVYEQ
jgi:hypothetical protein